MNNIDNEQNQSSEIDDEKLSIKSEKIISPEQQRLERINLIDQQLGVFNGSPKSEDEISELQREREDEYQTELSRLESELGQPLSEELRIEIHQNLVDKVIEHAEKDNENYDRLNIEKIILENIDNPDFRKRIDPINNENLSEDAFEEALNRILNADIELSREERVGLFRKTLEYYSSPIQAEKPLFHSTSSYTLRKSLEEGLSGGHGKFSGEASSKIKDERWDQTQKGLSVSHPNQASMETFQQLFARLCAKNPSYKII